MTDTDETFDDGLPVDEYAIRAVEVALRRNPDDPESLFERVIAVPHGAAVIIHDWTEISPDEAHARLSIVEQVIEVPDGD